MSLGGLNAKFSNQVFGHHRHFGGHTSAIPALLPADGAKRSPQLDRVLGGPRLRPGSSYTSGNLSWGNGSALEDSRAGRRVVQGERSRVGRRRRPTEVEYPNQASPGLEGCRRENCDACKHCARRRLGSHHTAHALRLAGSISARGAPDNIGRPLPLRAGRCSLAPTRRRRHRAPRCAECLRRHQASPGTSDRTRERSAFRGDNWVGCSADTESPARPRDEQGRTGRASIARRAARRVGDRGDADPGSTLGTTQFAHASYNRRGGLGIGDLRLRRLVVQTSKSAVLVSRPPGCAKGPRRALCVRHGSGGTSCRLRSRRYSRLGSLH